MDGLWRKLNQFFVWIYKILISDTSDMPPYPFQHPRFFTTHSLLTRKKRLSAKKTNT